MKKIRWCVFLSILFTIAIVSNAQSQVEVLGTQSMLEKLRLEDGIKGIQDLHYSDIVGDPFLFKDFQKGSVAMKNGEKYNALLRYDTYAGEIQFKENKQVYALINLDQIEFVNIDNIKFIHTDFKMSEDNGKVKETYFELLSEGQFKLLAKKNIRIKDPEPPKLYVDAKPAKFIILEDSYFIKNGASAAVRIKNKNDIKMIFDEKADAILDFTKKHKLKLNKKDDLIRIVEYTNQ